MHLLKYSNLWFSPQPMVAGHHHTLSWFLLLIDSSDPLSRTKALAGDVIAAGVLFLLLLLLVLDGSAKQLLLLRKDCIWQSEGEVKYFAGVSKAGSACQNSLNIWIAWCQSQSTRVQRSVERKGRPAGLDPGVLCQDSQRCLLLKDKNFTHC